jgi:SAM-dependent methyltransferase
LSDDPRLSSPSALRNREPILQVLRRVLPRDGLVLEVASGTGEHVAYFAEAFPGLIFQPTALDESNRASIDAWAAGLANVHPAMPLDATGIWPRLDACAVICINMIHIAPWAATLGLVSGAASVLREGGLLITYGPYLQAGVPLAPGNAAFDADLRSRNPQWGLREIDAVSKIAAASGFAFPDVIAMPANNLCLVFRKIG